MFKIDIEIGIEKNSKFFENQKFNNFYEKAMVPHLLTILIAKYIQITQNRLI